MKFAAFYLPFFAAIVFLQVPRAHAEIKAIPPAPTYYVLDEPHVLSDKALRSIQTLLIEHDRISGEQIMVALFKGTDTDNVDDFTSQTFTSWKIGNRGKDNGALLALFWDEHKYRIHVGYGLDLLTESKTNSIIHDILTPELKNSNPDRAISLALMEILRTIESPLVQNGKAGEILKAGGFQGDWQVRVAYVPQTSGIFIGIIIGLILLGTVLRLLNSAEGHFSSQGWIHFNPLSSYRSFRDILARLRNETDKSIKLGGVSGKW